MKKNELNNDKKKKITVKCPQCETSFSYYDSKFRPFCTEKCKMIDLGHWFSEEYAVAGKDGEAHFIDENGMPREDFFFDKEQ